MIRSNHLTVEEVNIEGMIGYQIQGLFCEGSDGMFEPIAHAAIFRTRARAVAALERCKAVAPWSRDYSEWGLPVGACVDRCACIQRHVAPYTVISRMATEKAEALRSTYLD